ncbi:uncharacterized protein V6R79_004126 [Siganus canaliculatus]
MALYTITVQCQLYREAVFVTMNAVHHGAIGGDIDKCVQLHIFYRSALIKIWVGYRYGNRSRLSELREVLCAFHLVGVVFAELLSVVVQSSSKTTLTVGVHTVIWLVLPSSICARLRFRHVELIQVVSDCWDRSDKPQKSDEIELGGCYRAGDA